MRRVCTGTLVRYESTVRLRRTRREKLRRGDGDGETKRPGYRDGDGHGDVEGDPGRRTEAGDGETAPRTCHAMRSYATSFGGEEKRDRLGAHRSARGSARPAFGRRGRGRGGPAGRAVAGDSMAGTPWLAVRARGATECVAFINMSRVVPQACE